VFVSFLLKVKWEKEEMVSEQGNAKREEDPHFHWTFKLTSMTRDIA